MAVINLNTYQVYQNVYTPGFLPDVLNVSGWLFSVAGTMGSFASGVLHPNALRFTGTGFGITNGYNLDPKALTGTVTNVTYSPYAAHGPVSGYTITGLNISLADLYAARGNIIALLTSGNDQIFGGFGDDTINAGAGNDIVLARAGNDTVYGDEGNDILYGEAGNDKLYGGTENDVLIGGAGADHLNGGTGIDMADYRTSGAGVTINLVNLSGRGGDAEGDTFISVERIFGSNYNDVVTGDLGANLIYGFGGNDVMYGLHGNDILNGHDGYDTIFGGADNDLIVGGAGTDDLRGDDGNDRLFGGDDNDRLYGGNGNDVLFGDAGNDIMSAGAGNDYVVLGLGNDIVGLGAGYDLVRFDYGNGHDRILDFKPGEDRIDFTHTDMNAVVLEANTHAVTGGVLMTLGGGSIFLAGVDLATIDFDRDFLYAH